MTTSLRDPALDAWGDAAHYDRNNPFPLFAQVRATGPVHEVRLADGHPAWLIVGHDEARAALADPRLSKDMHAALAHSGEVVAEGLPGPALARHMLAVDPPDHTRLRRMATPAFTRRRVDRLEERVRAIVHGLLDDLAARQPTGSSTWWPGTRSRCRSRSSASCSGSRNPTAQTSAGGSAPCSPTRDHRGRTPSRRRRRSSATSPRCSTASAPSPARTSSPTSSSPPATARSPSRRCSPRSSSWSSPGTTRPPASSATRPWRCCATPTQRDALVADPGLASRVVEEAMRWDAPVPHSTFRFATEDVRIGDVVIPAYAQVIVSLAAANRDPARYRDPEAFDISRTDGGHLAWATASTTASARRWPGWRDASRSPRCTPASPRCGWPSTRPSSTGGTATDWCCAGCRSCPWC